MSEDPRAIRGRRVLYVANPGSDSDERNDHGRSRPLNGHSAYNYTRRPVLPLPTLPTNTFPQVHMNVSSYSQPIQPPTLTTDLNSANSHYHPYPSLSSPSSTSSPAAEESTPPPTTPSLPMPPVDLTGDGPTIQEHGTSSYNDRGNTDSMPSSTSRTGKLLQTLKSPFRGPRSANDNSPRRPRTSPIVTTPDSYCSNASQASNSTNPEKVIIVATTDGEKYVTVDISDAKDAAVIRECIYTKMNFFTEEDQNSCSIYMTEIGTLAIGNVLTDEKLLALCHAHGDSRGSLKFFVYHPSAALHAHPSQPTLDNTPPLLPIPDHSAIFSPLRPRRRARSRHGSLSSASEHTPQDAIAGSGYEADLDNPDRDTHRSTLRPPQKQLITPNTPPSPHNFRRPSGPLPRPSSPLLQIPKPPSPPLSNDRQSRLQSMESTFIDKYGQVLPTPPPPPPLSPNRTTFLIHDDNTLSLPQTRPLHVRSGSDATTERDSPLKSTDQSSLEISGRQWRTREPTSRLRAEASKEALNTSNKESRRKRLPKESDDMFSRSESSWVLVPPINGRSSEQEPSLSPESTRPSTQATRLPNSNSPRYPPPSPYPPRPLVIPDPPRTRPPTVPTNDNRPPTSRPAGVPVPSTFVVTWKREGSSKKTPTSNTSSQWSRLGKGMTKSMDNLRGGNLPNSLIPGRRNPQLPVSRTSGHRDSPSNNSSGLPKSFEPPRTHMARPLPLQGSSHGSSIDLNYMTQHQYGSRIYASGLTSPNQEPYPRPQSAAGDAMSPSSAKPNRTLHSPTYGLGTDLNDSARSPRAMSPSRSYHVSGTSLPRNRFHNGDRSDRSSDIQSGPETTNTTPPRTPVSPKSPRHLSSDKNGYIPDPPSPLASEDMTYRPSATNRGSEATLRQDDHSRFAKLLNDYGEGTIVSSRLPHSVATKSRPRSLSPPPSSSSESSQKPYEPYDDDSDHGGGTWIVRPSDTKMSRPPLKVQIEKTDSESSSTTVADIYSSQQSLNPPALPPGSKTVYRPPTIPRPPPKAVRNRRATFTTDADDESWAPRPPPEDVYERLEEFFPEHDLDKPVIEANSGGTSPTYIDPPTTIPAPPVPAADKSRVKPKKSIRIVAEEHKKRIDRTSRAADHASFTNNMLRKRHTKMWGSKLEEVTTVQQKSSSAASLPESPSTGPTFKWVRGELIGKGTYGRVYLALNATTGEMIAVKQVEMPQTLSDKNDSRQVSVVQALKLESETLKDLDHPNIVQYLGFEETPSNLSIFLEYVPGGSVGSCLYKHGKFAENVTKSFTSQILSGLEYLHSRGILHRDLKADNILVEMNGTCKISDFGISKRTDDMGGAFTAMQGTVFWMAPEVINTQKKGYNFKIDIWSVGCVVLEMWAGMRPWKGEEMVAVMFKLYQSKLPPPVPEDVSLSDLADDFRRKCFAINPDERPPAAELKKHEYLTLPPDWTFNTFTED